MIAGHDFNKVYATVPRWEVLCVDEGQRRELPAHDRVYASTGPSVDGQLTITVKSDSSLIFARLRKLNTVHRLLLTGTPLNNNIRELFNLLNFLDPHKFT
jgi:SNF2 family DNA or RNA helicase